MLDVLVVDDDEIVRGCIAEAISGAGHRVAEASDGEKALALLATRAFDLAICDVHMPRLDGLTLFHRLRNDSPGTAVVIMTSFGKIPDVVGTLRDGAVDYVTKPFDADEFVLNVVQPIDERRALKQKFEAARSWFVSREAGTGLVGASLVMRQIADRIAVLGPSDASVLIVGNPGTGKKLAARLIHAQSPRRDRPFVVVPCASLQDLMLEAELRELSELRARNYRDEWFRTASGGTLVLDGIEVLPASAQSILMRVLDDPMTRARRDREWHPLGVRVISLSHESPSALLAGGTFSEALLFRLNAAELRMPPLGERDGDLYLLVSHFLRQFTPPGRSSPSLAPDAWKTLSGYAFPGNVRELAWAIEHAVAASNGGEIERRHLPDGLVGAEGGQAA
jgi:DNA-binding NtrC family response regulator